MDLVFEYAARYGGPPRPTDSWQLFVAGVRRCGRFSARELHRAITGPDFALASLSPEGAGERQLVRTELERVAFGLRRPRLVSAHG